MFSTFLRLTNRVCTRAIFSPAKQLVLAIALSSSLLTIGAFAQEVSLNDPVEKAATLIRDNRIEEAERQLNSVLRIRPQDAAALDPLGTIRAKQGKLDEAESLF